MSSSNRKKTFVDPQVQGVLVRRIVVHWVAYFTLASLVAFFLQVLTDPFKPLSAQLYQMWQTQGLFLLATLFLLPVFVFDTIQLTHRFVGPINRLRSTIRSISEGESPKNVKFRDFDFWQGLADDFNQMVTRLNVFPNSTNKAEDQETQAVETTAV